MKKMIIIFGMFIMMLLATSCATDTVVVYRPYTPNHYYYAYRSVYPHYYGTLPYVYHHPIPHHINHHKPHNFHHQPVLPPKPTTVPKATVKPRPNNNVNSLNRKGIGGKR